MFKKLIIFSFVILLSSCSSFFNQKGGNEFINNIYNDFTLENSESNENTLKKSNKNSTVVPRDERYYISFFSLYW